MELFFDPSCGRITGWLCRQAKYPYPVVYDDGLVSRVKAATYGREPVGIVFRGKILAINPTPKLSVNELGEYCESNPILERIPKVPSRQFMRKVGKKLKKINSVFDEALGTPLEAKYYLCRDGRFPSLGGMLSAEYCGINPHDLTQGAVFRGEKEKKWEFYPVLDI